MAVTIQEDKNATPATVVADRRIYLDADGNGVEEGDPEARSLFCAAGHRVSRAAAKAAGVKFKKPAKPKGGAETKTDAKPKAAGKTKEG